jgi:RNA polymerase sigma-70 factor (ECF subfamily)
MMRPFAHALPRFAGSSARTDDTASEAATAGATFEREVLAHLDRLYATALRLTRNPANAEDLVQQTCLQAFRHAAKFARGSNLRAWLFTILHNTFLNDCRRAANDRVLADSETADRTAEHSASGVATPEEVLLRHASDAEIRDAVDELPLAFREAVWLRDVEDLSYAEIATVTSVPLGTVMSRIARGRRLLASLLESHQTRRGRTPADREGA